MYISDHLAIKYKKNNNRKITHIISKHTCTNSFPLIAILFFLCLTGVLTMEFETESNQPFFFSVDNTGHWYQRQSPEVLQCWILLPDCRELRREHEHWRGSGCRLGQRSQWRYCLHHCLSGPCSKNPRWEKFSLFDL